MGLLVSLVAFGNLTDYETNFAFVQHVLTMDTTLVRQSVTAPSPTRPCITQHTR